MKNMTLLTSFIIAICGTNSAFAEPLRGVAYVGGTISESQSGYAGGVMSLPGASLGHGLAIRAGTAAGRYKYEANGQQIIGKYVGADAALVYQFSGDWGWANVSAGPHFSDTSLSPNDPGNDLRGSNWDLGLQSDGALDGPKWRLGWYGSYGAFDDTYQAKLQLGHRIGRDDLRMGIEAGLQGDPSYKKGFAGMFASKAIAHNVSLQISGGASEQAGRGPRAYGSIALSTLF
ncbi:cellulose biosynthesis protein BcsS [Aquisediminimonas sediminicola]|uniref:cellulose biosynthesis protein BcsS n=1 Tax=Alteraquisediminimonas sediminicola TaxID=2676787 RepID=UPI001C8E09CC|nr:cellulose biosynthesis protein BcsS [Aquisediminimonas sediminicola]